MAFIAKTFFTVLLCALPLTCFGASRVYVSNNGNGKLTVIDAITNTVITNISTGGNAIYGVSVNGTGAYVVDSGFNSVIVVDITNNLVERTISVGSSPKFIAFYGTGAYVTNYSDNSVSVIDLTTNSVEQTISVGASPFGIGINGSTAYVANEAAGTVSVIDLTTNSVSATINVGALYAVYSFAFSGTGVYVAEENAGNVVVIDSMDNTVETIIALPEVTYGIATSGTGLYVSIVNDDNLILIDTTTNTIERTVSVGNGPYDVAISGTGVYVANNYGNTLSLLDTTDLELEYTIPTAFNSPISIAFGGVPPILSSRTPADEATDVAVNENLELVFSEIVGTTGTGTVSLYKSSDNSLIEQISVTGSLVTGSGTTNIAINPNTTLENGASYYIHISANAFPDRFGNFFVGIANSTDWNFMTVQAVELSTSSTSNESGGRGGGLRTSTLEARMRFARQAASSGHPSSSFSTPEQQIAPSDFEVRVCQRVLRWFHGNTTMLARVNMRLQTRFAFVCR